MMAERERREDTIEDTIEESKGSYVFYCNR